MTEAAMWTSARTALVKSYKDDACRVENPAWPGTPDVHWCMEGHEGWLELKHMERWPVKGGVLLVDHFTPQQRVWLTRRSRAGGRCALLLKTGRDWLLLEGLVAAQWLGKLPKDGLVFKSLLFCPDKLDHQKLRKALIS